MGSRRTGPFSAQWEVISTGAILVIVPTLVVFLLLQRFISNGFTAGATKQKSAAGRSPSV